MILIYNSPVIKAVLLSFFSFFFLTSLGECCSCLKLLKSYRPKQWGKNVNSEPYRRRNRAAGSFHLPKNKNVTNTENKNIRAVKIEQT